jgi:hypothetical protein
MPTVTCPKCSARLKLDDDLDPDDRIECTRCGKRFVPPQEEPVHRGKKVQKAGGCAGVGCFLLMALICGAGWLGYSGMKQKALDDLAAADRLFAEGKKGEAAAKYKTGYSFAPDGRKPEIVARIADYEAGAGNAAEARRWITTGLDAKLNVTYETQAARDIHAQVQRERAEAEARKQAEAAKRKAEEEERRKGIAVSAEELRTAYAADRKAADAKYKGKTLRVTGTLHEYIAPEPGIRTENQPILSLQPNAEPWIWCYFSPSRDAEVRGLRPGQQVTVRGYCDGIFVGQIKLSGCSLEP